MPLKKQSQDADHLDYLDKLLSQEEDRTGKRVFKHGKQLRHGLIDVGGLLESMKQADQSQNAIKGPKSEALQWKNAM